MDPAHAVDVLRSALALIVLLCAIYLYRESTPVEHTGWNDVTECPTCKRSTKDGHRH